MIARYDDWPERLDQYFKDRWSQPFLWGLHDCCVFACDGVIAQSGVDPMKDARRKYSNAIGAYKWLRENGGTLYEVSQKLATSCGLVEAPVTMVGRGCPVLAEVETLDGKKELALGLVGLDARYALFVSVDGGYLPKPVIECIRGWSFD